MPVSRRQFLQGASACAVAAAVPSLARPDKFADIRLFEGSIGIYRGVVLREVEALPALSADFVRQLRDLAPTCHPRITPFGTVSRIVLEGIEADDA